MPIAVFRSLAGMFRQATRGRCAAAAYTAPTRPARITACVAAYQTARFGGEVLEDRCLFALAITPVPAAVPAANLVSAILIPNTGLTVTGATYVGADNQGGTYTGFDMTTPNNVRLNIRDGVILTTGAALDALGPNNSNSTGTLLTTPGDTDLDALVGIQTFDANALTVNFTTDLGTRSVLFDFIFGSEEFNEFLNSTFNDAFAAYLDGQQVSFDINGRPITVNNNFFQVNNLNGGVDIEYDGLTPRIRTQAPLNPTITSHTLKFVIADTGDPDYDSGVFLSRLQGSTIPVPQPVTQLPNPGVFVLASSNFTVDENAGLASVVINRINGTSGQVSVNYSITSGTATDGLDFTGSSGVVFFGDGQTTQTLAVPILDDLLPEGDESVLITLSNPDDAGLGTPSTGTLTILDNELAITFIPAIYSVPETAGSIAVNISRSGDISAPATVDYATGPGDAPTATPLEDFLPRSGTITFAAGQRSATVTVPILGDFSDEEQTETFKINLSNPTGAALGTLNVATVSILNVDRPPSIFDVTAFAPNGRIQALYLKLNDLMNAATVIDPANYRIFQHSEKRFNNPPVRRPLPVRSVNYDTTLRVITLEPMTPLKNNVFYEVDVRGTTSSGVISSANEPLDGNFDRAAGEDFVGYFGRGTRLSYFDHNGDLVKLGAVGGGQIEVFRDVTRDARTVRYVNPVQGSGIFGRVQRTGKIGDRLTDIGILYLAGVHNFLTTPPFVIGYII